MLLVSAILIPSALKFSHFFLEHSHVECNEHVKTHFHQTDIDCQLYKFHHHQQINYVPEVVTFEVISFPPEQNYNHYIFLNSYRKLDCSLRAPPTNFI